MRVVVECRCAHKAAPSRGQRVFVGFVILRHTLVIIAQTHRHAQRFCHVIGRLMVESTAPSGGMIELRCGIIVDDVAQTRHGCGDLLVLPIDVKQAHLGLKSAL